MIQNSGTFYFSWQYANLAKFSILPAVGANKNYLIDCLKLQSVMEWPDKTQKIRNSISSKMQKKIYESYRIFEVIF